MKTKIIFAGLLGLAVMVAAGAASDNSSLAAGRLCKGLAAHKAKDYPEAVGWWRKAAEQGVCARAKYSWGDV